jgi:hypothetical protein
MDGVSRRLMNYWHLHLHTHTREVELEFSVQKNGSARFASTDTLDLCVCVSQQPKCARLAAAENFWAPAELNRADSSEIYSYRIVLRLSRAIFSTAGNWVYVVKANSQRECNFHQCHRHTQHNQRDLEARLTSTSTMSIS